VIEWDILNKCPKSKYSAHAAIWSSKLIGKYLYLACEDGSVKILKIKKEKIELVKSFVKVDTRCLSVDIQIDSNDEPQFIYCGYADSSIRKWDVKTTNCVLHF